jgi:polyhydroxyalkanoate synthesis regulator phasin
MSDEKNEKSEIDPFAQMIQFYDSMSKSWSTAMSDAVASKSFAESMSEQMEGNLEAMSLMRKQIGEYMEQYLQQMNLPTRKEVITVAERLTKLEMAMDDLDAKMDEILDLLKTEE